MRIAYLLFLLAFSLSGLVAQTPETYSSVRVHLKQKSLQVLQSLGVETEHAICYPGRYIDLTLAAEELKRVQQAGFEIEILIQDLVQHYLSQPAGVPLAVPRGGTCTPAPLPEPKYETPLHYSYGAMGGFLTYDQMMAELDEMRQSYPHLISQRSPCSDTIFTWEGRPIYQVRISDNPDVLENEGEVLYTALHHAREPNSASQLIFFMWYLLENYDKREDIRALVNNLQLYFIPCINVDGYIFNQFTYPGGGGLWRKNRRDNGNGKFGVDLNRNYGHNWGELGGSSGDPVTETYRGPEPFSEPETRTLRDFCRQHQFLFVLNYHSFGDYLIYPWNYSDQLADSIYYHYGRLLSRENNYKVGTTTQTVGYNVNGSADDWLYAELGALAFTPEIGNTGFWPTFDQIDGFNKANLWQNLSSAYCALRYVESTDLQPGKIYGYQGAIPVECRRLGLMEGFVVVTVTPISPQVISPPQSRVVQLDNLKKGIYHFDYELDQAVQTGEELRFLLQTDNGFWVKTDTLVKIFEPFAPYSQTALSDALTQSENWTGDWALEFSDYHTAPSAMTDSPGGPYESGKTTLCVLQQPVQIPNNALDAQLQFFAKWEIEADWDYVEVLARLENGSETALCGTHTQPGLNVQPEGPVFDGLQSLWVEERMDLSDFIGQSIQIVFRLVADGFQEADGFYFDDLSLRYTLPGSSVQQIGLDGNFRISSHPNPASGKTAIRVEDPAFLEKGPLLLTLQDVTGRLVRQQEVQSDAGGEIILDLNRIQPGCYTYQLQSALGKSAPQKLIVCRP